MYARIFAVNGKTVDRRTNNHLTEAGLERSIRRVMKALPNKGPFMVERYYPDVVTVTLEG